RKAVLIDEWAITLILDPRGPFTRDNPVLTVLEYLPAGAVHRVKTGGSIVCIGAGGGLDLATALYFGQQRAVGVEINHVIVEAMKGRRFAEREYPAFSGQLYLDPRVEAVAAEGRHFLERTPEKFDIIQLSGVDTHSATEAGAFSLAENFLYTVEAFQAYFARLKPGGILTLTRWMLLRDGMPTQSLRLFTLACESLRRAGVADPGRHLYYFRSGIFAILLLSVEPFAPEALAALDGLVEAHGYDPLHRPHQAEPDAILIRRPGPGRTFTIPNLYQRYLEALATGPAAVAAFHADYPFNVAPPTDDRPFFFEDHKFESLWRKDNLINPLGGLSSHATLALLFLGALVAGYGFLCAPLRRLSSLGIGGAPRSVVAAYFGAIGLAYLLVEIPLSQRFILFLGQPAHALTVILFSLLVFSGLGSFVAGRLGRGLAGKAALASLLAAALAVVLLLALPAVLATCLGLALPARVAISVGLLAPLGFLMGFPFPLGIRLMESSGTGAAVPWAWAMNGYASVLASVGAVILGITWGFTTAVLIAAACYVAAAAIAPALGRGGTAAGSGSG
ncbi:MAG: hypothetical protein JXQ29_18410, partial [Planctomycetes bacterium]|nr:hypothetical protein [Planctomycetota bacterium]